MPRSAAASGRNGYPAMMDGRWRDSMSGPVGQQFVAPVTVRDPDTVGEYDETTHTRPRTPGSVVYEGPGRLIAVAAVGTSPENAGQTVTLRGYRLSIPYPGIVFKPGQSVRFTSGDPILDARRLTVTSNQSGTSRIQTDAMLEDDEG